MSTINDDSIKKRGKERNFVENINKDARKRVIGDIPADDVLEINFA